LQIKYTLKKLVINVINYKFVFLDKLILIKGETMSFQEKKELGLSEFSDLDPADIQAVCNLFKKIEKDSDPTNTAVVDESYYSAFLFCDPENTNVIKKEDFLKFIPIMSKKYTEMGFKFKKVKNLKVYALDSNYFLVQIYWEMLFNKDGKEIKYDNIKATYILRKEADDFRIILQLDHQILIDIVK
jgi:hypothetical protein